MQHVRKRLLGVLALFVLLVALVASTCAVLVRQGKAAGATPLHIWLHYDYLVGAPDGHSDAPDPAALQLVVDAFAAHGVTLEIDNHHNEIPWKPYISLGECTSADTLLLPDVKAQYFHPTSNHDWDYVLFGDSIKTGSSTGQCVGGSVAGEAWLGSYDFVIALANILQAHPHDITAVGGIFMHELGHNLGLNHGGDEATNWKPNYISVMNYRFQYGIPYAATPGSTSIVGRRLDYSDTALPTLDKSHLNETLGIQGGPTDTDITSWYTGELLGHGFAAVGPASGPIDWNQNGTATDTDVKLDVDYDVTNSSIPYDYGLVRGFDDWAYIRAVLLGQIAPGPKTVSTDGEAQEPVVSSIAPSSGSGNGGATITIKGTHLGKATQVIFGAAGAAQFSIVSDKTITAVAPLLPREVGGLAPPYTADVTVVAGAGPSPSVVGDQFTYLPVPAPTIASISPLTGPYTGGTAILIQGSNFTGATSVSMQDAHSHAPVATFAVLDDSTISAVVPPFLVLSGYPLKTDVIVTTLWGGTSGQTSADQFTYVAPPPTITSVSPASGPFAGGTTILITGHAFLGLSSVAIRDPITNTTIPVTSFTVLDDTTISAVTPSAFFNGQAFGTVDVIVTTQWGGSSTPTPADQFTYLPTGPIPTITSISPMSGPASGGTTLLIRGSGFTGAISVSIGLPVTSFTVLDDSTISAVTPNVLNAATGQPEFGTVDVRVTTPDGGTSALTVEDRFTFS